MYNEKQTLEEALLAKGIDTRSVISEEDAVIDEGHLEGVANAWKNNKEAIVSVIQARIDVISAYLLYKAHPVEVAECRRSLVELSELITDFDRYSTEFDKRNKPQNNENEEEEDTTPPSDEGKSSL